MNDNSKIIDQDGNDVLDPKKALMESSLAVDLQRADFDQAIVTAHKYPRVLDTVIKQIETMACYNEESAANCIYSLPRGGKPIIGPSIGFANILATAWGNCIDGGRPTHTDRKEKSVYAEGVFHDLQSNRRTVIVESRRIVGRNGQIYSDDMIIITGKAAASIARRNAILNAVPRALWHPIWEQALRIVRGDMETFAERKDKAMKAFAQFGVKPEQVYMFLGLKGDVDLTLEHIPQLRGMYQALRDQSVTVEEMFDPRRMTGKGFDTVANPLGEHVDEETGEVDATAGMGEPVATQTATTGTVSGTAVGRDGAPKPIFQTAQVPGVVRVAPGDAKPPETAQEGLPLGEAAKTAPKAEGEPAKPAGAAEATQAAAEPLPTNFEQYMVRWRGLLAKATSPTAVKNLYGAERALRNDCKITNDELEEVQGVRDQRVAELQK